MKGCELMCVLTRLSHVLCSLWRRSELHLLMKLCTLMSCKRPASEWTVLGTCPAIERLEGKRCCCHVIKSLLIGLDRGEAGIEPSQLISSREQKRYQ